MLYKLHALVDEDLLIILLLEEVLMMITKLSIFTRIKDIVNSSLRISQCKLLGLFS